MDIRARIDAAGYGPPAVHFLRTPETPRFTALIMTLILSSILPLGAESDIRDAASPFPIVI